MGVVDHLPAERIATERGAQLEILGNPGLVDRGALAPQA